MLNKDTKIWHFFVDMKKVNRINFLIIWIFQTNATALFLFYSWREMLKEHKISFMFGGFLGGKPVFRCFFCRCWCWIWLRNLKNPSWSRPKFEYDLELFSDPGPSDNLIRNRPFLLEAESFRRSGSGSYCYNKRIFKL